MPPSFLYHLQTRSLSFPKPLHYVIVSDDDRTLRAEIYPTGYPPWKESANKHKRAKNHQLVDALKTAVDYITRYDSFNDPLNPFERTRTFQITQNLVDRQKFAGLDSEPKTLSEATILLERLQHHKVSELSCNRATIYTQLDRLLSEPDLEHDTIREAENVLLVACILYGNDFSEELFMLIGHCLLLQNYHTNLKKCMASPNDAYPLPDMNNIRVLSVPRVNIKDRRGLDAALRCRPFQSIIFCGDSHACGAPNAQSFKQFFDTYRHHKTAALRFVRREDGQWKSVGEKSHEMTLEEWAKRNRALELDMEESGQLPFEAWYAKDFPPLHKDYIGFQQSLLGQLLAPGYGEYECCSILKHIDDTATIPDMRPLFYLAPAYCAIGTEPHTDALGTQYSLHSVLPWKPSGRNVVWLIEDFPPHADTVKDEIMKAWKLDPLRLPGDQGPFLFESPHIPSEVLKLLKLHDIPIRHVVLQEGESILLALNGIHYFRKEWPKTFACSKNRSSSSPRNWQTVQLLDSEFGPLLHSPIGGFACDSLHVTGTPRSMEGILRHVIARNFQLSKLPRPIKQYSWPYVACWAHMWLMAHADNSIYTQHQRRFSAAAASIVLDYASAETYPLKDAERILATTAEVDTLREAIEESVCAACKIECPNLRWKNVQSKKTWCTCCSDHVRGQKTALRYRFTKDAAAMVKTALERCNLMIEVGQCRLAYVGTHWREVQIKSICWMTGTLQVDDSMKNQAETSPIYLRWSQVR